MHLLLLWMLSLMPLLLLWMSLLFQRPSRDVTLTKAVFLLLLILSLKNILSFFSVKTKVALFVCHYFQI